MEQIGKYKVLGELGRGGFGAVYLCEDNLGEKVAVKVFDPKDDVVAGAATSATSDAGEVLKQRFQAEARTLRRLSSNPYIVDLYDFDETEDGMAYYVMPYLAHSLVDEIGKDAFSAGAIEELDPEQRPRRIPVNQVTKILTEILEGMRAVHREGLVHRDLKPANILFDPDGKVQVCDFGIAKLPDAEHSQSGVGMGSRNYMSPEQRESAKHVEASSDVYSIGIMAYRMVTGTLPGGRFDDPIVFAPTIGQSLNDLILAAISYEVGERPKDATEFLKRLRAAIAVMDDSAPEDEVTGTWVERGESSIRDELKPLRNQIERLLLEYGEIPEDELDALEAVAQIGDLDMAGFESLVAQVSESLSAEIRPIQNFLKLADTRLANSEFGDKDRKALYAAGVAIGWDEVRVDEVISNRSSFQVTTTRTVEPAQVDVKTDSVRDEPPAVIRPEQTSETSPPSKETARSFGKIATMLIAVLLVGGGGWYAYDQQQIAVHEEVVARERTRLNKTAWEEATRKNTAAAFRDYLKLDVATADRKQKATENISNLWKQEAEKTAEDKRLARAAEAKAEKDRIAAQQKPKKSNSRSIVFNNGVEARYTLGGKNYFLAPNTGRHHQITAKDRKLVFHSVLGDREVKIETSKPMKYELVTVNWDSLAKDNHYANINRVEIDRFRYYNQARDLSGKDAQLKAIRLRLPLNTKFSSNRIRGVTDTGQGSFFTTPYNLQDDENCMQVVQIEFSDGHSFEQSHNMCHDGHFFINYGNVF